MQQTTGAAPTPKWLAWGQLLRLSMAPSALADAAAGLLLGAGAWPGERAVWMLAAAFCAYHGGMALNDWADRAGDARTRPERPLPSGVIGATAALGVSLTLLLLGPLLAWQLEPRAGAAMLAVSAMAALYDLRGRGAWTGPLLLGLCRAGNLAAGMIAGAAIAGEGAALYTPALPPPALLCAATLYGAYVFWLSRLGRLEDAEDDAPLGQRPRGFLLGASACLLLAPLAPLYGSASMGAPALLAALLAAAGAWPLARIATGTTTWSKGLVMSAMGMGLRRLLVFTAVLACASGASEGPWVAAVILAGYPLAHALRRVFPPS